MADTINGSFQTDLGSSATAFLPGDQPDLFASLGNAVESLFASWSRQLPSILTGSPALPPAPLGLGAWPLSTWLLIAGGVYLVMGGTGRRSSRRNPGRRRSPARLRWTTADAKARAFGAGLSPDAMRAVRAAHRAMRRPRRYRKNQGPGAVIRRLIYPGATA